MSTRLLTGLAKEGGFALAAFCGTVMVGFCYGFPSVRDAESDPVLYLQLIAVATEQQNCGLGRAMMECVATVAAQRGMSRIRWAFDPLDSRNAHFYLDVLGARGRRFVPNMYGSDADGKPTHRVVADWLPHGARTRWPRPAALPLVGTPCPDGRSVLLTVAHNPVVYDQLERLIGRGFEMVSCQCEAGVAVLRLETGERRGATTTSAVEADRRWA